MREGGGRRGKKLRCEMRSRVRMKGWEEGGLVTMIQLKLELTKIHRNKRQPNCPRRLFGAGAVTRQSDRSPEEPPLPASRSTCSCRDIF